MSDVHEQLRDFIEFNCAPVSAEEVMDTSKLRVSHHHRASRGRRLTRGFALVAAAAVLITIVVTVIPGTRSAVAPPASAATFLATIASTAAKEPALIPGPGRYLYVASINSVTTGQDSARSKKYFWYVTNEVQQTWTSSKAAGHQTDSGVGRPLFLSPTDRRLWESYGSPPFEIYSRIVRTPTYYDVTDLPTKASLMAAYFKGQYDIPPREPHENGALWDIPTAVEFLQNGASSLRRAALLRFIASGPGVRLGGRATSIATHRTGTVIAIPLPGPGWRVQVIFDPATSDVLEVRSVVASLVSKIKFPVPVPAPFLGEIVNYSDPVFTGVTRAHSGLSRPLGTPTFPASWPYGASRTPLPESLSAPKK
jgi:hypothetical protein